MNAHRHLTRHSALWILAGITLLAAVLRLWALDTLPPGLYHDEAYNGLDALSVLRGQRPLFFEANNGREPLYIYLSALSVVLLGRTPGALRLVSALVGTLTVLATYGLARELYDRRVGLIAAALVATTVWTLNLSRVALRAGLLPLFLAVTMALLWRGLRQRRAWLMALAGLCYGLSFYTYLAARFTVLIFPLLLLYFWRWHRPLLWRRGWLLFGLCSLVAVAPLGVYFVTHWQSTLGRTGQVSILNPAINGGDPLGTLLRHVGRTVLGLIYRGDFIPRHNVPLRPIFDPLIAIAFGAGLLLALRNARRSAGAGLALIWLGVMLLPTILAEDAPHMLRAVGVLPALLLFPAVALAQGGAWLARRSRALVGWGAVVGVLLLSGALGVNAYTRHLHSLPAYYNFEAGATQLAAELNRFLGSGWQGAGLAVEEQTPFPGRTVYLASRLWQNWSSVRYLCPETERLMVLPEHGVPEQRPSDGATLSPSDGVMLLLWPFEDNQAALSLLPRDTLITVREGAQERGDLETDSRLLYIAIETQAPQAAPTNAATRWERGVQLLGYRLEPLAEQRLAVSLYWRTDEPLDINYTVFAHVLQQGAMIGQHDGPAAGGYYATDRWRPGDIVEDRHVIELNQPYNPQSCEIAVGLYDWATMQHLTLLEETGQPGTRTSVALR